MPLRRGLSRAFSAAEPFLWQDLLRQHAAQQQQQQHHHHQHEGASSTSTVESRRAASLSGSALGLERTGKLARRVLSSEPGFPVPESAKVLSSSSYCCPRFAVVLWASFDSGFASCFLFLVAMLLYIAAALYCYPVFFFGDSSSSDPAICNSMNFWGALLFVVESALDIAWGLRTRLSLAFIRRALAKTPSPVAGPPAARGVAEAAAASAGPRDALLAGSNESSSSSSSRASSSRASSERAMSMILRLSSTGSRSSTAAAAAAAAPESGGTLLVWDRIDWDLWAAVFFFVPSVFYLIEATFPNALALGNVLDWAACLLFVLDSVIGCIGRWRYILATPPAERLWLVRVWHARSWRELDWMAWGDIVFFFGSLVTVHNQISDSPISCICAYLMWTVDALFYLIGCTPWLCEGLAEGAGQDAEQGESISSFG